MPTNKARIKKWDQQAKFTLATKLKDRSSPKKLGNNNGYFETSY